MSNNVNQMIREEAQEWAEVFVSTMMGDQLEMAIKSDDLDRMRELITECRRMEHETRYA